jgi:hypothetical protein
MAGDFVVTDERRQRITEAINTWVTPILLSALGLVMLSTWNTVRELAEAMPTVQHRVTALERGHDDHEARLRYVERVAPAKEQWP